MRVPLASFASLLCLVLVGCHQVFAENWPQWRGPDRNGVAASTGLPVEWSPTENVAWRAPLAGPAGSTPVVWGDRVFLTTSDGDELKLLAFSTVDGKLDWQRAVSAGNKPVRGDEGNYASPSPVTDGHRIAALVGDGTLACFTLAGEPLWRTNLQDRYGRFQIQFGYTSTPALFDGKLYVQMIHGDGDPSTHEARVACLDFETGDEVWSVGRVTGAKLECEHAYTSPVIYDKGGDVELLTHGADYLVSYDPDDGRELWRLGGMNPPGNYHPTLRFVASPAIAKGLIVVPTAKKGPVFGVKPGGVGESERVAWKMSRNTPDVPSPLIHDGLVYLCGENGNLTCVEAETGETVYRKRTVADRHRASPVLADDRLYLTSRNGVVTVVRAGREFEILAQNDLGEEMSASPAIANGTIYLRTFDALYAIRN